MGLLPYETLLQIHKTTVSLGLSRDALLDGIDPIFVATLPPAPDLSAQILRDLAKLNQTEFLADGTVPLVLWLEHALALSAARVEAEVFSRVLLEMQRGPAISPRVSPELLTNTRLRSTDATNSHIHAVISFTLYGAVLGISIQISGTGALTAIVAIAIVFSIALTWAIKSALILGKAASGASGMVSIAAPLVAFAAAGAGSMQAAKHLTPGPSGLPAYPPAAIPATIPVVTPTVEPTVAPTQMAPSFDQLFMAQIRAGAELDAARKDLSNNLAKYPATDPTVLANEARIAAAEVALRKADEAMSAFLTPSGPLDPLLLDAQKVARSELDAARKDLSNNLAKYPATDPTVLADEARIAAAEVALRKADEALWASMQSQPIPSPMGLRCVPGTTIMEFHADDSARCGSPQAGTFSVKGKLHWTVEINDGRGAKSLRRCYCTPAEH